MKIPHQSPLAMSLEIFVHHGTWYQHADIHGASCTGWGMHMVTMYLMTLYQLLEDQALGVAGG